MNACVNVGLDPSVGTREKISTSWLQVYEYFEKSKAQYQIHKWLAPTLNSKCKAWWGKLSCGVSNFAQSYNSVLQCPERGENEDDHIKDVDLQGKKCAFEHALEIFT